MLESESIHRTELGWFVWLETNVNDFGIMMKAILWISLLGLFVTYAAAALSVSLGLVSTKISFKFFAEFTKLSFASIQNGNYHSLWMRAAEVIMNDMGKLFFYHSWIGAIASYFFFKHVKNKSEEMEKTKFNKGTKIISEDRRIEDIKQKEAAGILITRFPIGRIFMPIQAEIVHTLVIATTGGGKGVLASKIIPLAGADNSIKAIVHDKKPEWGRSCYKPDRGDLIFNPMDARSLKWTIWNDIKDLVDIKAFASWIVPDIPGDNNPYWQNSARGILESILLYLWNHEERTNSAIREMINLPSDELSEALRGLPGAEYAAKQDSLSTLKTQMQWVDFLQDGDFSVRDWVENQEGILFLLNPERTQALFRPVLTLFVNVVGSCILDLSDDRNRRIHLFLDEFTSLNRLDKVISLLTLGRSKGAAVWLFFQDIQRAEKIYSKEDLRTIINNCKNVAIGQIKEPEAAEYLSKRFGKMEFYENVKTSSMGTTKNKDGKSLNDQRKEDFVVKATDLQNLPERQFFVVIDGYEGVTRTTADIQNLEKIAEDFVPIVITKEEQLKLVMTQNPLRKKRKQDTIENDDEIGNEEIREEVEIENIREFF